MIILYNGVTVEYINRVYPRLYSAIEEIDSMVQQNAGRAYNLSALNRGNPKLNMWYEAATDYLDVVTNNLIYARYGYAVEELTNISIGAKGHINGYKILTQVNKGLTRPDIVIPKPEGFEEIAWIDITSQNSQGHILYKKGSGWNSNEVVAEVTYDDFNPDNICFGDVSIATRIKALSTSRQLSMHNNILNQFFTNKYSSFLSSCVSDFPQHLSDVAIRVEDKFGLSLPRNKHTIIKSMIGWYKFLGRTSYLFILPRLIRMYKYHSQDIGAARDYVADCYDNSELFVRY